MKTYNSILLLICAIGIALPLHAQVQKEQMVRLRNEFGVYGTDTGRMCVAALNSKNIDYVCASIAKVM